MGEWILCGTIMRVLLRPLLALHNAKVSGSIPTLAMTVVVSDRCGAWLLRMPFWVELNPVLFEHFLS
jgi:hypothetical protein